MRRKNVRHAAALLPKASRQAFMDAFMEARCMDLYDGNLTVYLQVITSILRGQRDKLNLLRRKISEIRDAAG